MNFFRASVFEDKQQLPVRFLSGIFVRHLKYSKISVWVKAGTEAILFHPRAIIGRKIMVLPCFSS